MSEEYRCVIAKNGAKKYYKGKKAVKATDVPKNVLASLVCSGKGKALVEERLGALEKTVSAQKKRLERETAAKEKKKLVREVKKEVEDDLGIVPTGKQKTSAIRFASKDRSRSPGAALGRIAKPALKGAAGAAGRAKKDAQPSDYEFLRWFWKNVEVRNTEEESTEYLAELITQFEKDTGSKYPYEDRDSYFN